MLISRNIRKKVHRAHMPRSRKTRGHQNKPYVEFVEIEFIGFTENAPKGTV